jgi:hypothetical protein
MLLVFSLCTYAVNLLSLSTDEARPRSSGDPYEMVSFENLDFDILGLGALGSYYTNSTSWLFEWFDYNPSSFGSLKRKANAKNLPQELFMAVLVALKYPDINEYQQAINIFLEEINVGKLSMQKSISEYFTTINNSSLFQDFYSKIKSLSQENQNELGKNLFANTSSTNLGIISDLRPMLKQLIEQP